jgi:hypothetical protein
MAGPSAGSPPGEGGGGTSGNGSPHRTDEYPRCHVTHPVRAGPYPSSLGRPTRTHLTLTGVHATADHLIGAPADGALLDGVLLDGALLNRARLNDVS